MHIIPGLPHPPRGLLARHIPSLAEGIAAEYVEHYSRPGDLLLDPFGQSPQLALEAFHLKRRVVVANFNPVVRFSLRLALDPLPETQLRAALTQLGDARLGDERLETHLESLYRTTCPDCGAAGPADYFEWDKEKGEPIQKTYFCQTDSAVLTRPTDPADVALAKQFEAKPLSYHWALERAAPPGDPDREHAAEALGAYTSRAVYAIVAVLHRLEALGLASEERRALDALLLAAFDEAASIWPAAPELRHRPKTVQPPARFREFNLWRALENAVGQLAGIPTPGVLASLNDVISSSSDGGAPGVCVFKGSSRDLAGALPPGCLNLILTMLPRPLPALWGLSMLWAAWLWGANAAAPIKPAARHRRADYDRHEQGLRRAWQRLQPALAANAKMIGIMTDAEPPLTEAILTSCDGAGFALRDWAYRNDPPEFQACWERSGAEGGFDNADAAHTIRAGAVKAGRACLQERGEPAAWPTLHAGVWMQLAGRRALRLALADAPERPLAFVEQAVTEGLSRAPDFIRYGAKPEAELNEGLWWGTGMTDAAEPLADRTERVVAALLRRGEALDLHDLDAAVCRELPGASTPDLRLVRACLNSYGATAGEGLWRLRHEDSPQRRADDLRGIVAALHHIGTRLGYIGEEEAPGRIAWKEGGEAEYLFIVQETATLGALLTRPDRSPRAKHACLVVPGGRAGLIEFKSRRDPRIREAIETRRWRFVKFRHVRRLAAEPRLDRASFAALLDVDPIVEKATAQMPLL